jgi:hypothetical protein
MQFVVLALAVSMSLALSGCGGGGTNDASAEQPGAGGGSLPAPVDGGPPIASAGADREAVAGTTVMLDGSASTDPRGTIARYDWSQTAGPTVALHDRTAVKASFTVPQIAADTVLTFELRVTDDDGHTAADSVDVTATPARPTTPAQIGVPTANAGADGSAIAGTTVTLDGSASSDQGGVITRYEWSQTSGPSVTLTAPTAVTTSFAVPQIGAPTVLTFALRIVDNEGHTATDSVDVLANPAPQVPAVLAFEDITTAAGVGGPTVGGGHGGMFSDVNGDGLPDLYVTMNLPNTPLAELFFLNLGAGVFREEAAMRGIDDFDSGSHGGVWADLDNDGDLDLFNGSFDQNRLYRNNGSGMFSDVTFASALPARESSTRAVVAFDMEGDGDLDIFAVNGYLGSDDPADERNEVYRNNGNGTFTSIESGALYGARAGQGATAVDFDNDGDIDVFAANRTGPIAVLRNDGRGDFTAVDPGTLGLSNEGRDGITFADVNNDGFHDVLLSQVLYLHDGVARYVRRQAFDTDNYHYMGSFADLDNDADFDLAFPGANRVFLNDGAGNFAAGDTFSVGTIRDPRSIAFADIEHDGDLDFFYGQKHAQNRLIRNDSTSANRWLKFNLRAPNGQRSPYGVRVYVYELGGLGEPARRIAWWELRSKDGYLSQQDSVVHLGVGNRARVAVRVTFLGGTTVDYDAVPTNAWVEVDGES